MEENNENLKLLKMITLEDIVYAREAFNKDIKVIEDKYIEFFSGRPSKHETEPHDRLNNHFIIIQDKHKIEFAFNAVSDIPQIIKKECMVAFKERFNLHESD